MDAIIYARESMDRTGKSENCDIQILEGQEYCEQEGHNVVAVLTDNDISASRYSTKPRPDYNTLIKMVRDNEAEVIVVTETSRIYRRLEELIDLFRLAETTRFSYLRTTSGGGYDLSTPEGRHSAIAAVNDAILESEKISQRVKRKERVRARQGSYHGGRRPYGWEGALKDDRGRILNAGRIGMFLVPEEATTIRECAQRVLDGQPIYSILRDLNLRGIPTASGGQWDMQKLKNILTNPDSSGYAPITARSIRLSGKPSLIRRPLTRFSCSLGRLGARTAQQRSVSEPIS